jgi:glycosyltransferase involved in cell wall biosynthesis
MKIIVTGMMGPGTLEAKIEPLARLDLVSDILFIRKTPGKQIPKTKYITPPLIKIFGFLHPVITPLTLLFVILKDKPKLVIGYHIIPYGLFAAIAGLVTNTPYVIAQTGLTIQKLSKKWYLKKILHFFFRKALQVNCPGTASVNFWQEMYPDIQSKFKALHSTIDTDFFVPAPDVDKNFDFIFLGRLDAIKRIDMIIEGFSEVKKSADKHTSPKMVIVGDGPDAGRLKELVARQKLQNDITFTGFVSDPLIWLQQSRFLVMASLSEGLPTAMMQAMACGVIPVTNLVGNIPDLVGSNITGIVHTGQTLDDVYFAMEHALALSESELTIMKHEDRNIIIENHSFNHAIEIWCKVLKNHGLV